VLEKMVSVRDDAVKFESTVQSAMSELLERVKSNDAMKEVLQNEMTVMTVSLENAVGNTVSQSMERLITSKINEKLRSDLNEDLKANLVEVRDFILSQNTTTNNNNDDEKTQSEAIDVDKLEETLTLKMSESIDRIFGVKVDGLLAEIKRSIIPQIEAATEELRMEREAEEKETTTLSENELFAMNNEMKRELEILRKEKDVHDEYLKNAATTKVHELVKLQNLLDHMRSDNRLLQHQLKRYRERFQEIKDANNHSAAHSVVNRLWTFWPQRPRSHLST